MEIIALHSLGPHIWNSLPSEIKMETGDEKSHTCEEGGAHLRIFLVFIDEPEKQIITKKLLKWANTNKIISIFTMLHF